MEKKRSGNNKNEIYLISAILIFAFIFFVFYRFVNRGSASMAVVSVSGDTVYELPLGQDNDIIIQGAGGGTNRLIIKDGFVSVTEASCPDQICVREGAKREKGEAITCLPNKVIITVR